MALIADLSDPGVPYSAPKLLSAPIANSFPTPPVAWAWLVTVDPDTVLDGVSAVLPGAVYPESLYLEPTIGQIWPR